MCEKEVYSIKVIPRNIRIIMDRRGYSAAYLSRKSGISDEAVSEVLRGRRKPCFSFLDKIMDALHIGIEELTILDWSGLW